MRVQALPRRGRVAGGSVVGAALALAAGASAGEGPAPPPRYTPFVDRSMYLPAPFAYATLGSTGTLRGGDAAMVDGAVGGGVGLSSRVWIDGSVGTFQMAPRAGYHSPQIGLSALLLDTPAFELDVTTHVAFAAADGRPVEQIEPGFFAVVHVAHKLRLDGGVYLDVNPGPTPSLGGRAPLSLGFQITEKVHGQLNSGVTVGDFADPGGTTAVPLGLSLGWIDRLGGPRGPSFGVLPTVTFPELWKPGAEASFRPDYATVSLTLVYVGKL